MSASPTGMFDKQQDMLRSVQTLLGRMTLVEKIGQMSQVEAGQGYAPDNLGEGLRSGLIGSVINVVDVEALNELQRIAVEESRLGIPLLIGRLLSFHHEIIGYTWAIKPVIPGFTGWGNDSGIANSNDVNLPDTFR